MKEYTSKIVALARFIGDANIYKIDEELNKMAKDGWELANIITLPKENDDHRFLVTMSRTVKEEK
ncbi:MAG: DUF4177 domain-containing protein [Ruminiclostridium sp.]|nr:DUF4177 domain-containing protein [Ruminiclostridium sp.]